MSQTNEAATAPRAKSVFFATPACLATGAELARLLEVGRWAEQEGYRSIWVTEDLAPGGHPGGGAALAAALVQVTSRIQVRAVVALPHHPIRVAEEWSMLDNLSRGRTGVCLALPRSGSPAARNELLESARAARSLFAGGGETFVDGMGNSTTIHTFPRPTSSRLSLSVWCEDREDLALARRRGK